MTGINFNNLNSYTALYNTSQTQLNNTNDAAKSTYTKAVLGEQLTLSAEAIALSKQSELTPPTEEAPSGGGEGIRPPESATLGGGEGIRPPESTALGGGEGIRPPESTTLGGGEGIRPPLTT